MHDILLVDIKDGKISTILMYIIYIGYYINIQLNNIKI